MRSPVILVSRIRIHLRVVFLQSPSDCDAASSNHAHRVRPHYLCHHRRSALRGDVHASQISLEKYRLAQSDSGSIAPLDQTLLPMQAHLRKSACQYHHRQRCSLTSQDTQSTQPQSAPPHNLSATRYLAIEAPNFLQPNGVLHALNQRRASEHQTGQ